MVFVGRQDGTLPTEDGFETANFAVNDGSQLGGNVDVFFLPRLVVDPTGNPDFGDRDANPDLRLVTRICLLDGTAEPECEAAPPPQYFSIWRWC